MDHGLGLTGDHCNGAKCEFERPNSRKTAIKLELPYSATLSHAQLCASDIEGATSGMDVLLPAQTKTRGADTT
jgi:hypothetical protein